MTTAQRQPWGELFDFWFHPPSPTSKAELMKRWFVADAKFDEALKRFEPWLVDNSVRRWEESPEGALTRVLLYDQLPRNLYRGMAKAFAWDPHALSEARRAVDHGWDLKVEPIARGFFYLPFEHDETLPSQEEAVRFFRALAKDLPLEDKKIGEIYVDYAERHRDVIAKYGRFPHRNRALGRESTPAELAYLAEPGAGF